MSLPPGFLDELRTRVSIASVVGRKVTWDTRKSNHAKGDMWAPCPFHQEKTASFHVDDRKGFYYCFGCHAKGDALTFLRETENMTFIEAVGELARQVGMAMPERDPQAAEKADRNAMLAEVCEAAARFFGQQLTTTAAAQARAYLAGRGLGPRTQERFGLGFAPDARQALWSHLTGAGVAPDLIVDAGLAARPDDGGAPYDRFRGRIMFPIRDARGRCIAFGGRALNAAARAKYLNSPETALFDKGRTLYNLGPARGAVAQGATLIVAEGYMDVIALVEAGFEGAVAPLGTAVTQTQLQLFWRLSPEPVIALDGDAAGVRAGYRLIDLALPLLGAEQSLRFCLLPGGQDPDDVLRAGGCEAMRGLIENALPLVQLLWQRETQGQRFDVPERRAALDKRLRSALSAIPDPGLRGHYADALRTLRSALFSPASAPRRNRGGPMAGSDRAGRRRTAFAPEPVLTSTRATLLAATHDDAVTEHMLEARVLASLIAQPSLLVDYMPELETLDLTDPRHARIGAALLQMMPDADPRSLVAHLEAHVPDALEALRRSRYLAADRMILRDRTRTENHLRDSLLRLRSMRGSRTEARYAMEDFDHAPDERVTRQLAEAARARHEPGAGFDEPRAEFHSFDNGLKVSKADADYSHATLAGVVFERKGRNRG